MTAGFDKSTRLMHGKRDVLLRTVAEIGINGLSNDGRPKEKVTLTFCPILPADEEKAGKLLEELSSPIRSTSLFTAFYVPRLILVQPAFPRKADIGPRDS